MFSTARLLRMALVASLLVGPSTSSSVSQQAGDSPQPYSEACLANLDSFERVTCRYVVTSGVAKNMEDAIAGRFVLEKSEVGKALWLKRGRDSIVRFEEDPRTTKRLDDPKPKLTPMPG